MALAKDSYFDEILAMAATLPALKTAVAAPEEPNALAGALVARQRGLIDPILVGDAAKIRAAADTLGEAIDGIELLDEPNHSKAAAACVAMVHEGRADAVMKGHLHTEELLAHVVKREGGLRGRRRLSHVFVMDVPGQSRLIHITDAAINIAPDLKTKADIAQNAIDLARAMGVDMPKLAVLSAVEVVNPDIPSTLDAAALAKMADRGQIKGGLVDGPLAMDNAVSAEAARIKGIVSDVAGHADILLAPNLESGNMCVKQLTFLAGAKTAGLVVGAKVPVILTSRADDEVSRLASCAAAALYNAWLKQD